jgi:predicted MFS family arabinose efflux permease
MQSKEGAISDFRRELRTGWRDLVGATLGLACGAAMYTPIQSLFFRSLELEFHWSRATLAASLIALPITAIIMPAAGRLIDRFGVRLVAIVSVVMLSVSFVWLSAIGNSPVSFYAGVLAFNVLGAATTSIGYTRPVAQSFVASRGTAVAIASSGIAIAGILLPPLLGPILARGDWRVGYEAVAVLALVGGVVAVMLVRTSGNRETKREGPGLTRSQAIRTRDFWKLGVAIFAVGAASVGFVSQLQSVAFEFGVPLPQTVLVLSATSLSTLCFRILSGWALDAVTPQRVAAAFIAVSALGQLIWLFPLSTLGFAIVGAVFLGIALGSEHVFMAFFCARLFGLRAYSAIFGALNVFLYFGMGAGAMLFALCHDLTSSYGLAIATAIVLMIASASLFLALPHAVAVPEGTSKLDREAASPQRVPL